MVGNRDPARADGRRVLYVEDSPADLALVEEVLRTGGMAVQLERVADGEEALTRIREAPPDLVLLDLRLPRIDGVAVVERLRADPKASVRRTPVVVLSSSAEPDDIGRAYDAGANCFLDKPVNFEAFSRAVAAIVSLWLEIVTVAPRRG